MTELLLGFMTSAWLFTLAGGAYGHWRYVRKPWEAMRASLVAEKEAREAVERELISVREYVTSELGLRKATLHTDEEVAQAERRLLAKRAWSS